MTIINILNEFKDTSFNKKKDDRDDLKDYIWKKFYDGVAIKKEDEYKLSDGKSLIIKWRYHKTGFTSVYKNKTIIIEVGMNSIPLKNKEWDLRKFELSFKEKIEPVINDYYKE